MGLYQDTKQRRGRVVIVVVVWLVGVASWMDWRVCARYFSLILSLVLAPFGSISR